MVIKKNQLYIILCLVLLVAILVSFFVIWIYINNNSQTKTQNYSNNSSYISIDGCHMDPEGCNRCCYETDMNTGIKTEVCKLMDCAYNGKSVYDK